MAYNVATKCKIEVLKNITIKYYEKKKRSNTLVIYFKCNARSLAISSELNTDQ